MKETRVIGKKASNKPHTEDRVEKKLSGEMYKEHTPQHGVKNGSVGDFEMAHVVHDGEAHKIKMSREKQKMGLVKKQDYSKGVGEPPKSSARLPHHNDHDPGAYLADDSVFPKGDKMPHDKD